ncbi:prepilin-type N-terminal cleavage/methylation domain-containing protein [Desulfolucanica intricata]|uniref:prepilin-type N-terminal cleavage/methylation domain-containing protein n=1 Tax=Desulfolucanica intricata TaxID=1285191 RepID=UPI000AF99CE1|nr:prepilin-type N-terminal cleavage/methylation domain-containing protein [Desulfolucanica intricata]
MRKFFKKLKDRKGFTLVELMMVVAVIGILAAVLIPKMTGARDNARLAGVEANANQVQAHVESLISRYRGTTSGVNDAGAFQDALVRSINNDATADDKDISNPFVAGKFGAAEIATDSDDYAVAAVGVGKNVDKPDDNNENNAGLIYVKVVASNEVIDEVTITPYDGDGNAMTDKEVTIEP